MNVALLWSLVNACEDHRDLLPLKDNKYEDPFRTVAGRLEMDRRRE